MWPRNISQCFACTFRKSESRVTRNSAHIVKLLNWTFQYLQYDWAREFPDNKKYSINNLSIDLLISNSHGPSMYTLSMGMTYRLLLFKPLFPVQVGYNWWSAVKHITRLGFTAVYRSKTGIPKYAKFPGLQLEIPVYRKKQLLVYRGKIHIPFIPT